MTNGAAKGIVIAAPSSGSGKTTVTLALLRALKSTGHKVVSAKSGPDYIDPKFHEAASGEECINLDAWAMKPAGIRSMAAAHSHGQDLLVVEAAMGLFDGAANGKGSAADLAAILGLPVVLVIDCARQAQSVAALVSGFAHFRSDVEICGVLLNKVGSARHEAMLRTALAPLGIPVIGALPRKPELALPERHLGLVQAGEHEALEEFLTAASNLCKDHVDLDLVASLCRRLAPAKATGSLPLKPLAQRIAIARDIAFAFSYPHMLNAWQQAGAELSFFSPLEDEAPDPQAGAIFLPGGYPELHAGTLASASRFKSAVLASAEAGTLIYGECGGYMTLGESLIDANGIAHEMLGLLPLQTSFATRKRHLGYRQLTPEPGAPFEAPLSAHEFHYASIMHEGDCNRLFQAADAEGNRLDPMGLRRGSVMGSFAHVICEA